MTGSAAAFTLIQDTSLHFEEAARIEKEKRKAAMRERRKKKGNNPDRKVVQYTHYVQTWYEEQ